MAASRRAVRAVGGAGLRRGVHSWICKLPVGGGSAVSPARAASFCCMHLSFGRRLVTFLLISYKPRRWSWSRIYHQKAHESSFPTMCLPNGNVVKFSYMNRKHFPVGDLMAFPIVKMGNKPPKSPSPCTMWTPMPRPTACTIPNRSFDCWSTVAHVRHKVPIGYNGAPNFAPKVPLPVDWSQTQLPASSLDPSDLWRQTASGSDLPFFHNAVDRQTDRPTDRSLESLMTI